MTVGWLGTGAASLLFFSSLSRPVRPLVNCWHISAIGSKASACLPDSFPVRAEASFADCGGDSRKNNKHCRVDEVHKFTLTRMNTVGYKCHQ